MVEKFATGSMRAKVLQGIYNALHCLLRLILLHLHTILVFIGYLLLYFCVSALHISLVHSAGYGVFMSVPYSNVFIGMHCTYMH